MPKGVEVVIEHGLATVDFLDRKLRGPALIAMLDEVGPELVQTDTSGPRKRYIVPINAAQAAGLYDGPTTSTELTDADKAALGEWLAAESKYNDDVDVWLAAENEHKIGNTLTGVVEPTTLDPATENADPDPVVVEPAPEPTPEPVKKELDADDFKVPAKRAPARKRSTPRTRTTANVAASEPADENWG